MEVFEQEELEGEMRKSAAEVRQFNQRFVSAIEQARSGELTKVSSSSGSFIRRRIRENGFSRNIITPENVTNADLDRFERTELPGMIEDMEPHSPGAKAIPFNDTPDTAFYRGDKYTVFFCKISTKEFTKNVDELRTYKMDLRQVITDNALKDIQTEEDARFITEVDDIVGPSNGVGASGEQQNFDIAGDVRRVTYVNLLNHIQDRDLNNGVFLMNRHTANEFLKWDHDEWGGSQAQAMTTGGLRKGLNKFEIMDVPHIATIKRDIVPNNVVYQFTEEGYLGKFCVLSDVTMYVEKRIDIIRFRAHEKIGLSNSRIVKFVRGDEFEGQASREVAA